MNDSFLIQVGDVWISSRRRVKGGKRYLLPCHNRDQATRFPKDEAERIAADLRRREELFTRFNERDAQPVLMFPSDD